MQVRPIGNQVSFQAVNKKYFEWAKKDFARGGNVSTEWLDRLSMDVFLFREITAQDGADTINAVKQYMKKTDECIEEVLSNCRRALLRK